MSNDNRSGAAPSAHKSHAEIIAKMRNYSNECNDGYHTDYGVVREDMCNYADRLEAAHKRELDELKKQIGNAARLREALDLVDEGFSEGCLDAPGDCPTKHDLYRVSVIRKTVKAALSAPPRNCDVGTAEEQAERLHRFCIRQDCATCPCNIGKADGRCEFVWAQMPYKEGGNK